MAIDEHKAWQHIEQVKRFFEQAQTHAPARPQCSEQSLAAWFLGPKAENRSMLTEMMTRAIQAHCEDRLLYQPDDPVFVTDAIKHSDAFSSTVAHFNDELDHMLKQLRGSIPLASYRNQSHMYWDITLPGAVGYLAAMLYNQNNVAVEASPVTTYFEIEVGKQLCRMLGYTVPDDDQTIEDTITPWSHITCDGSVANLESMWAARNLKFFPVAIAAALQQEDALSKARAFRVKTLNQQDSVKLVDLDTWSLLNLRIDDVIHLAPALQRQYGIAADDLNAILQKYSIQNLGMLEFYNRFMGSSTDFKPQIFAPSTAHYSWSKGAAILGLGSDTVNKIHVDLDCRMDMVHLREHLDRCLQQQLPVLEVVAVIGSTEESAVDPLAAIVAMREEYRTAGLEFSLHIDGAWGGYFASMLRGLPDCESTSDDDGFGQDKLENTPSLLMSDYLRRQYEVFDQADSITIDPHKSGYLPYPAGGLCYRNGAMRNLVSFTAPVVYHGGFDPTVGIYGVEGSKPGAAAAGVYLSHQVIPTDASGYGRILGKCFWNSKRLYAQVITMAQADDPFIVVPVQRLPAEKAGASAQVIQQQFEDINLNMVTRPSNQDLMEWFSANPASWKLFQQMGSDQIIITYAFNFRHADGQLNRDVALCNQLNFEVFRKLSLHDYNAKTRYGKVPDTDMFVTQSAFDADTYGQPFVDHFGDRLGLDKQPGDRINFLISTTQNPWISNTAEGNMIPRVVEVLRQTVIECVESLR